MSRFRAMASLSILCIALPPSAAPAQMAPVPGPGAVRISQAQNAVVGLVADGPGSTVTRIAADMAQCLDDDERMRVLPILGDGSVQNIADLIYLKGVDLAIVHADALTRTMQTAAIPREASIQYIAKLFPEEVHALARKDIATLADLDGKPVAVGASGSGLELTATAVLDSLHIVANVTHDPESVALEHLRRGDIAAMFVVGGKPVPMLQAIEPGTGLHFLPVPLNARLLDDYLPTTLGHGQYPNLVPPGPPVGTVAVDALLVTLSTPSDSARAKRVNRFIDALFGRFDRFHGPGRHPKWQEVNLAAQVLGWPRYPEALAMLRKDQAQASKDAAPDASFDAYLRQSGQALPGIDDERREALFRDYLQWRKQRSRP